jgi:hypothetical protein
MKLTEWIKEQGYGFAITKAGLTLTGEWISDYERIVFDADATIEKYGDDYRVTDSSGVYRLTEYDGSGPNGEIKEWS